jgi:hypothetical protein
MDPKRTKERRLREEPRCMKSRTLTLLPILELPKRDKFEPRYVNPRTEIAEPKLEKSRIETADPRRAMP